MHLGFHGGKCCGIKVIHGMGAYPEGVVYSDGTVGMLVSALDEIGANNADAHGSIVSSKDRFFHEAAPSETSLARLDRYIEYCDRRRPNGIIEITLASARWETPKQTDVWPPFLEERGFKLVNSCQNSNSGNRVFVYHRNTDVPGMEGSLAAEQSDVIDDEIDGSCDECGEYGDDCCCD
jgi:hypothetical protein